MALEKRRGYAYNRPFYNVDSAASINAGMVAFLANDANGNPVATTAPSGTTPIGVFWKDHNTSYFRNGVESHTFNASNTINLRGGRVRGTGYIKVTNAAGTAYTQGTDYTVNTTNGVVTRVVGGNISYAETVIVWYEYSILASEINLTTGTNYDRAPDDTQGSGKIAIVEGFGHIYTDQYDPTQAYTLNATLRSDAQSRFTTAATAFSVMGRVIKVPSASDKWLGVALIPVAS